LVLIGANRPAVSVDLFDIGDELCVALQAAATEAVRSSVVSIDSATVFI
jgi:hypothetical protein